MKKYYCKTNGYNFIACVFEDGKALCIDTAETLAEAAKTFGDNWDFNADESVVELVMDMDLRECYEIQCFLEETNGDNESFGNNFVSLDFGKTVDKMCEKVYKIPTNTELKKAHEKAVSELGEDFVKEFGYNLEEYIDCADYAVMRRCDK